MLTLITVLGKGTRSQAGGYRKTVYQFPDGRTYNTAYFGIALARYLQPDRVVVLGTQSSMWDVFLEDMISGSRYSTEKETFRLALSDRVADSSVSESVLRNASKLLAVATGFNIEPYLISSGRNDAEQLEILRKISQTVTQGDVAIDVTHGYRHLGMISYTSGFMLERLHPALKIQSLWYGALDMTSPEGITPVLQLSGIQKLNQWIEALDRFDISGNYDVFVPLLLMDGVEESILKNLQRAAYQEGLNNISEASNSIRNFLTVLDRPLRGPGELFREKLKERLQWVTVPTLSGRQAALVKRAIDRGDLMRACMLAYEAVISRACERRKWAPLDRNCREDAAKELGGGSGQSKRTQQQNPSRKTAAYRDLSRLRNTIVHGHPPTNLSDKKREAVISTLKDAERLRLEIQRTMGLLLE